MYRCTIQDNCPTSTAKLSQYVEVEVFLINCLALRILVGTINCLRNLARQLPGQLSTMDIVPAGAIESPRLFCCCCCCDNCLSGQLPHATQGGGQSPRLSTIVSGDNCRVSGGGDCPSRRVWALPRLVESHDKMGRPDIQHCMDNGPLYL